MENEAGNGPYKKIGIGTGTLFILMMVGFFVFVFFDHRAPGDHAGGHAPAAQTEEHASPDDHAVSGSHAPSDDHAASEEHAASGDHSASDDHAPSGDHAGSGDHAAAESHSDHGEKTAH